MANRRHKGSGTIVRLEDDKYRVFIVNEGQRLSRVFTARNMTEANRAAGAVILDLIAEHERRKGAAGAEREQRRMWTVERYVRHYLEVWAPYHLADTTRTRYASIFRHNVCPYIGKMRMSEVTPSDLTAMYAALASPKSRKRGGCRFAVRTHDLHRAQRSPLALHLRGGHTRRSIHQSGRKQGGTPEG